MSNTPEFNAEQLAAARSTAWHQAGEPLVTLDSVRDWITASGIVLFAPRPLQLPSPAPSLVEATLGASSGGPTTAQIDAAKSLVARLVAEGNVLPLNLLGIPGDLPDFVVSAQVFSFIYTLRGEKAWKLAPSATGPTKSSPLGIRIFEVLTEKGALSAADIANEVGRETTESAIQRSLTELWSNLRVIPLLPQVNGPVLWELTSRRFTKAIKAGINAGQPTALSALISLYLAQALLATEDEVETFLSPLAARSRIREVLHALTGSRQLETIVLDGKSLMHIPGTLPAFPEIEKPEPTEEELAAAAALTLEGDGRIKKFNSSSERRAFGDFKGKPARALAGGTRPTPRFSSKPDGERRPFTRDAKPSFTKPWEEDRKPAAEGDAPPAKRPYTPRAANAGSTFAKKPYTPREGAPSDRPKRPYTPREGSSTDRPKRPYTPREGASSDRPARPAFGAKRTFADRGDKPAFRKSSEGFTPKPRFASADGERKPFEKKPYERKPFVRREGASSDRPARPSFGAKRTLGDKPSFGAKRPFADRGAKSDGETFPKFRKFDAPKRPFTPRGDRPEKPAYGGSDSKPRAPRAPKSAAFDGAPKRPFPRKEGDLADRPVRPWPTKTGRSDGRPGGPGSKPRAPRKDFADRGDRPARASFGDRPARPSFGAKNGEGRSFTKKPFGSKPFAGKSGGFSKRPPAAGGKVSFDSKPTPRRGTPGVKPSFPRKPRPEHTEE